MQDENTKSKILNSAVKLFAKQGFDGTSIREICKDAGVNISMISYWWGGKKELYDGITDELITKQNELAKDITDFNKNPKSLSINENIELLKTILYKLTEFLYSGKISGDLIVFLIKKQQTSDFAANTPLLCYFRKILGAIFDKDENDKEIIYKTLFLISHINSPKILPAFSLNLIGQDNFYDDDIKIIKHNLDLYLNALLKEAGVA